MPGLDARTPRPVHRRDVATAEFGPGATRTAQPYTLDTGPPLADRIRCTASAFSDRGCGQCASHFPVACSDWHPRRYAESGGYARAVVGVALGEVRDHSLPDVFAARSELRHEIRDELLAFPVGERPVPRACLTVVILTTDCLPHDMS